jgi:hypothetical protein
VRIQCGLKHITARGLGQLLLCRLGR